MSSSSSKARSLLSQKQKQDKGFFPPLTLAALGVVFGDIGTSPLYAFREAFLGKHSVPPTPENILGVLSLIFWSMVIVISIKYLSFVMKANNKGEGGVLALTSLAVPFSRLEKNRYLRVFLYLGLFGSALLIGDGMITPAISVLSAIEGLKVATPLFSPFIIPITLGILTLLFMNQHHGTKKIGKVFGFIVLIWFIVIGVLGIFQIVQEFSVLRALNPFHALQFFTNNGVSSFVVMSAVFLVITGGEALYADMGHFGRKPIEAAWFFIAFPCLVLNYFGQGALLLGSSQEVANPFYQLAPRWGLYPLVFIATLATIIASQAVISGVFSLVRQAIQLGYSPRFHIIHTSKEEIGQIYIPKINWMLFAAVCWLVLNFKSSEALAAAYGVAVSTTMVITTILACLVARRLWGWGLFQLALVFLFFFIIDTLFLSANLVKITHGGWFPLAVATIIFILMTTWKKGRALLQERLKESYSMTLKDFLQKIEKDTQQIDGTAIFMTGNLKGVPPALLLNVKHNKILHKTNVLLTIINDEVPYVSKSKKIEVQKINHSFYRVIAHYGFMESPNIREVLRLCRDHGLDLNIKDISFFLGREILLTTAKTGMPVWRGVLFSFMLRNSERATSYFKLPPQQVIEMGMQIRI